MLINYLFYLFTQPEEEKKLLEELLKETETSLLHHQSTCPAVSCQKAQKSLRDKFKHEWLTDKSREYGGLHMWRENGRTAFCVVNTTQRTNRTNPKSLAAIQQ